MENNYEIVIDFNKNSDVSEVFNTLYKFTLALNNYNNTILGFISKDIVSSTDLIEISKGSIKTKVKDIIKKFPDDSAIELFVDNPKELVKILLKDCRKTLFKLAKIEGNQQEKEELLINEIDENIKNNQLSSFGYTIKRDKLFDSVNEVYKPLSNNSNTITIKENNQEISLNDCFNYEVEKTFKSNIEQNTNDVYLKIKKPVFLGKSLKWEFIYGNSIDAEIKDEIWLNKLKNREIPIYPGDVMFCKMKSKIIRNDENEIVESHHDILKVYKVITPEEENYIDFIKEEIDD